MARARIEALTSRSLLATSSRALRPPRSATRRPRTPRRPRRRSASCPPGVQPTGAGVRTGSGRSWCCPRSATSDAVRRGRPVVHLTVGAVCRWVGRRPAARCRRGRRHTAARARCRRQARWGAARRPRAGAPASAVRSSARTRTSRALDPLARPHDATRLEQVHEATRLGEADAQLALEHRRRAELRRDDELGRLQQHVEVVADVVVDLLLGRRRP